MNTNDTNRQKAHSMIDHIFKDLFPAQGMTERSEQIKLSHRMLDTMLDGGIALCDAGTGIGKTYEAGQKVFSLRSIKERPHRAQCCGGMLRNSAHSSQFTHRSQPLTSSQFAHMSRCQ